MNDIHDVQVIDNYAHMALVAITTVKMMELFRRRHLLVQQQ